MDIARLAMWAGVGNYDRIATFERLCHCKKEHHLG